EAMMDEALDQDLAPSNKLGRVKRIDDAPPRYIEIAKQAFPKRLSLKGLRIAIDCANGAGYRVAPTTLYELGAEVFPVGVEPNGLNINAECGSTHPETVSEAVKRYRCDIGIALDGDADRVIICDEKGHVVDGDQIMALTGLDWAKRGRLNGRGVGATVMSDLGRVRRAGRCGRRGPAPGPDRSGLGRTRAAGRQGRGRHRRVRPGTGAPPEGRGRDAGAHQGRRSLRHGADARGRLQHRRRTVWPH